MHVHWTLESLVYHANANVIDDQTNIHYLYVMSKMMASYNKDEKTRKKTAPGEKPLPNEYLTFQRFLVEPTTEASHGHTLGIVTLLEQAYCAQCKGGATGWCLHVSESCFIQHFHWGLGWKAEPPSTISKCAFMRRGVARNANVTEEAHKLMAEKLPKSAKEGVYRSKVNKVCNASQGISANYDQWDGNAFKHSRLSLPNMFSMERPAVARFFALNRAALARNYRDPAPWESDLAAEKEQNCNENESSDRD